MGGRVACGSIGPSPDSPWRGVGVGSRSFIVVGIAILARLIDCSSLQCVRSEVLSLVMDGHPTNTTGSGSQCFKVSSD
jgi:hypothetical protein